MIDPTLGQLAETVINIEIMIGGALVIVFLAALVTMFIMAIFEEEKKPI